MAPRNVREREWETTLITFKSSTLKLDGYLTDELFARAYHASDGKVGVSQHDRIEDGAVITYPARRIGVTTVSGLSVTDGVTTVAGSISGTKLLFDGRVSGPIGIDADDYARLSQLPDTADEIVEISADTDATANKIYLADTTSGQITITLPAVLAPGYRVRAYKTSIDATPSLIVDGNGIDISGSVSQEIFGEGQGISIIASNTEYVIVQDSRGGATVTSVNGQVGTVVLDKSDVGLGSADDTSDADKPVSTAQQTALDLKADATSVPTTVVELTDVTSAGSGEIITNAERSKLAGLDGSKFLGTYVSLAALESAHPSPVEGSYGYVDAGVGTDVTTYIWDSSDNSYVSGGGTSSETPATIKTKYESNADTNAFTDAEKAAVATNTSKVSFDAVSSARLANTSGTNTGDQDLSNLVDKTSAETIAGVKTFSSSPIVPAATGDTQAMRLGQFKADGPGQALQMANASGDFEDALLDIISGSILFLKARSGRLGLKSDGDIFIDIDANDGATDGLYVRTGAATSNLFTLKNDGTATFPLMTEADIIASGDPSALNKEYGDKHYGNHNKAVIITDPAGNLSEVLDLWTPDVDITISKVIARTKSSVANFSIAGVACTATTSGNSTTINQSISAGFTVPYVEAGTSTSTSSVSITVYYDID